jgi:isopenicillin N synthase-like dioxygenase
VERDLPQWNGIWNEINNSLIADPDPDPLQWPEEEDLPGFKTTFLRYLTAVENLSNEFTELVAEAFGLPPDGLAQFYGARDRIQHRSKVRWWVPHTPDPDLAFKCRIPSPPLPPPP